METKYLTIKEFALRLGKSQQAIYKQVERKLNKYVKLVDNQKMIDVRALQEVYGAEVEQPIQPKVEEVEQPIQPLIQATIESLNKELERKTEELKAKDKQYNDLQITINEQLKAKDKQIENLTKLLDQEQQLNAINQQKLLAIENKQEETPTPKKFWKRLFKK